MDQKGDKYGFLRGISLGIEFAVPVLLFAFLGLWLDKQFGLSPLGVISGVILGAIIGFWNVYKFVLNYKQ